MTKEKALGDLLEDLQNMVITLKSSLPKESSLIIPKPTDPLQILHLREACYHRITELADSACSAFKQTNMAAGYLLAKAIMETFALFWCFVDQLKNALKHDDLEGLRGVLARMAIGVKVYEGEEQESKAFDQNRESIDWLLTPMHVTEFMKHVAQEIPPFKDQYDYLCEMVHPNSLGLIRAYVKNDWDRGVSYFGKEQGRLGGHLESDLEGLLLVLEGFMTRYRESEELLEKLRALL